MLAQVKPDSRMKIVMAFTGHEYVRYEWRPVPEGAQEEARKHPLLDVMEAEEPEPESESEPEPAEEPAETGSDPAEHGEVLLELNVKDAAAYIGGIDDESELYRLLEVEGNAKNRAGVLKKIESRIDEITQSGEA